MTTRPSWCDAFIAELREMARKHGRCDVSRAADLAGTYRMMVYRYRASPHGREFRAEWDTIVLQARQNHSSRHR